MENAAEALKIAFAMFIFVLAITIIFMLVGQAKSVTDSVAFYTDETSFYTYKETGTEKKVSIDQVIRSLYNYDKENVCIQIFDTEGLVTVFDLSRETKTPWLGSSELIHKKVDWFIYGMSGRISENIGNGSLTFNSKYSEEIIPQGERLNRANTSEKSVFKDDNGNYVIATAPLLEVEFKKDIDENRDYFFEQSWVETETTEATGESGKKITREKLYINYYAGNIVEQKGILKQVQQSILELLQ